MVERSQNQIDWQTIVSLAADSVSYTDSGLEAEMTYFYRVYASNIVGDSAFSNVASATTDPAPSTNDHFAESESTAFGTVSGSYLNTHGDDGQLESISEVSTSGKPSKRRSRLEHTWHFTVPLGKSLTLIANAWSGGSTDADEFRFDYSTDNGSTWNEAFTVTSTDTTNIQTKLLNAGATSTVWVQVIDTNRQQGNSQIDTVFVDELRIQSETSSGNPPADPDSLSATISVDNEVLLNWNDNATDETGYEIERKEPSTDWQLLAQTSADTEAFTDTSALPNITYDYRVKAFNGSGYSNPSNIDSVTLDGISLTTNAYKTKGKVNVELNWTGADTGNIDIFRDGVLHTTTSNDGNYVDATGLKHVSFTYQICEAGSTSNCSNTIAVNF